MFDRACLSLDLLELHKTCFGEGMRNISILVEK